MAQTFRIRHAHEDELSITTAPGRAQTIAYIRAIRAAGGDPMGARISISEQTGLTLEQVDALIAEVRA